MGWRDVMRFFEARVVRSAAGAALPLLLRAAGQPTVSPLFSTRGCWGWTWAKRHRNAVGRAERAMRRRSSLFSLQRPRSPIAPPLSAPLSLSLRFSYLPHPRIHPLIPLDLHQDLEPLQGGDGGAGTEVKKRREREADERAELARSRPSINPAPLTLSIYSHSPRNPASQQALGDTAPGQGAGVAGVGVGRRGAGRGARRGRRGGGRGGRARAGGLPGRGGHFAAR